MSVYFPYLYKEASTRVKIVTWADGTPQEIAAMMAAADAGKITLSDYWSIGDKRTIAHAAMPATNVGETHAAQNQVWVLMDTGANSGYKFADDTPVHYVVGTENCFDEMGYMNSPNTDSWENSQRRTWCNNELRNSLDADTQALFKQFKTITASGKGSATLTTTLNYFALFAEKEIMGYQQYSSATEAAALTQIDYYKIAANCIKNINSSATNWWGRSPYSGSNIGFSATGVGGTPTGYAASNTRGLAPFGCI